MENEVWKDIPWFPWYKASDMGRIIGKWNREMKLKIRFWYCQISLLDWYNKVSKQVHRLVMLAFVWPSDLQVNHKNGIKTDNRLENLEYCTSSENLLHAYRIWLKKSPKYWTWKYWKDNKRNKIVLQFSLSGEFINEWYWTKEIWRILWLCPENISSCCRWKRNTAWWYSWKYSLTK